MKKLLLTIPALAMYFAAQAQNVGIGTTTPNASAALEVFSTNKGLLIPRLGLTSITDATTVPTPATGLMVYNTNTAIPSGTGFYVNTGTPAAPMWAKMPTVYSNNAPATGQSLIWNGTTYAPAFGTISANADYFSGNGSPSNPLNFLGVTLNNTVLSGNGTTASPININTGSPVYNANQISSRPVNNTAPTANQVLVWDAVNNYYKPGPVNAVQIQGGPVSTTTPTNNQVLIWDAVNNIYKPAPVNAVQIQNRNISVTAPTNKQVLVYNTTTNQWEPGDDTWGTQSIVNQAGSVLSGNGTIASPLNVNTTANVYNANKINNSNVSATTPTNGQVLVFNATTNQWEPITVVLTDTWGTQSIVNQAGSVLSGNGTVASPLNVNTNANVYNANKINNYNVNNTAPTANQVLVWDAVNNYYKPGPVNAVQIQNRNVSVNAPTNGQTLVYNTTTNQWEPGNTGDNWGTQAVVNTAGSVLSGNGTAASPLNVNTNANVYNANKINNVTVSNTAPVNGQTLVYNNTTNTYAPSNVVISASNGLTLTGTEVKFGGPLTSNTTVNTSTNTLALTGSALTTTFDNQGEVGIGVAAPTNALHVNATNPLRLEGLQAGTGSVLVVDANGVVKKMTGSLSFNYSKCSTSGFSISQGNETGAVPYVVGSAAANSIQNGDPYHDSWTAIPGLSKTFNIASGTNSVSFSTEGVVEYNGTLSSNGGWVSYAIAIFVDGALHATRTFTMTGSGGVDQFDTYHVAGQFENMSVGDHTIAVYGTRRNSPGGYNNYTSNQDLYFCAPAPNYGNTNAFMNRGVLMINGSY